MDIKNANLYNLALGFDWNSPLLNPGVPDPEFNLPRHELRIARADVGSQNSYTFSSKTSFVCFDGVNLTPGAAETLDQ